MRTTGEIALAAIDAYSDNIGDIWQDAPDDAKEWVIAIEGQVRLAVREAVDNCCVIIHRYPGDAAMLSEIHEHFRKAGYLK